MNRLPRLPRIDCDECGERADTVHLLPWVTTCEQAVFACPSHDAGGYWFELDRLWSVAEHVAQSKRGGYRALARICERLGEFSDRDEARFSAALRRSAIASGEIDPDWPEDRPFSVSFRTFASVDLDEDGP